MFTSPGEIAFHIWHFPVYFYGIFMGLSLTLGILTALTITKKYYPEINPDAIIDISPSIIICAIIGARLYYCLLAHDYYQHNLLEIFQIWQGGISIHGGIIGGLFGGYIYAKNHKLPILKLCDIFSYGLVLGQALGRWGNFFNSEAFGKPTDMFLKLYISPHQRPLEYLHNSYFHPTFLYESILDACIFLILFFIIKKHAKDTPGVTFFSYLILYSCARILVEQIRIDSVLDIAGIPVAILMSISIILIAAGGLLGIKRKQD